MSGLPAFSAYGIELEYMIVDRHDLSVRPIADLLLRDVQGKVVDELERGALAWSNELALHVIELKNVLPDPALAPLVGRFQAELDEMNRRLADDRARLMPGGMHPWMAPAAETRLWPHQHAEIYRAYDRLFGCRQHGFANLQSMHLNLPFADDAEFVRLHAAARLLLPVLPALAASSPILDGRPGAHLDGRMAAYCRHQALLPESIARVIPDSTPGMEPYRAEVLEPMYRALAPHDPEGVLCHEWLNARGVIPRFDRMALEIRVIDVQECPRADLAIAALTTEVLRALYDEAWSSLADQQAMPTGRLADILQACILDGDKALINDREFLRLLDYPGLGCSAAALWAHLIDTVYRVIPGPWREPLNVLREEGPLARRILRSVGPGCERDRLHAVYGALCDCLAEGRMFLGLE